MSTNNFETRVAIAICTRERPQMLRRLLDSIVTMNKPHDLELFVIVVENGSVMISENIVSEFSDTLNIDYSIEQKLGLVYARNTAIEKCLETNADWVAFVDDDEWIDCEWLMEMMRATQIYRKHIAFAGPINRIDPESATKWFPGHKTAHGKTGSKVWNVGTGNILFNRCVYATEGYSMRFDERFNLSGGEDTFLFLSMRKKNVPIIWVQDALCSENVLPSRAVFSVRFGRTVRYMHNFGAINQILLGPILGRLKNLSFAAKMLFHFFSYVLASILVVLVDKTLGQSYIAIAVQKLAVCIGYIRAIFLPLKPVYKEVDGH